MISPRLVSIVAAATLGPLLFGYHMAELNAPQEIMTCQSEQVAQDCIAMDPKQLGLVVAMNAVGGCIASVGAGPLADKIGRRRSLFYNCALFIVGSMVMAYAKSVTMMGIGRLLAGMGSGAAIVVGPLYVNELSPPKIRGTLGALVQLAVTIGIVLTQFLGILWSTPSQWRLIFHTGWFIGGLHAILLPVLCVESPKWLALKGMLPEAKAAMTYARGKAISEQDFEDELAQWREASSQDEGRGLLSDDPPAGVSTAPENVSFITYVTDPYYRKSAIAVIGVMSLQQFSGINSIVFYGVAILKGSLPSLSGVINVLISLINCFVTASIAPLVDKKGRRVLLLTSMTGMTIFSFTLSLGLYIQSAFISSVSALLFVVSFGTGLGAVPFLIISELTPSPAAGIAQSVGTTANWIANFLVGFLFPILSNSLGSGVFLIFTVTGIFSLFFTTRFVPETKGKATVTQVWSDFARK